MSHVIQKDPYIISTEVPQPVVVIFSLVGGSEEGKVQGH